MRLKVKDVATFYLWISRWMAQICIKAVLSEVKSIVDSSSIVMLVSRAQNLCLSDVYGVWSVDKWFICATN